MKLHARHALLPDGWADDVQLDIAPAGDIARVTRGAVPGARAHRVELLVPGMANLHSHAFQRAMAGLAEVAGPGEDSFWSWREVMYGFLARLGPDDVEAIAAQLYVELLRHGFTAVAEFHYLHHDVEGRPYAEREEMSLRCIEAARACGIAITHLPVLYAHGGFGGKPPAAGQRRFLNTPDALLAMAQRLARHYAGDPDVRIGVAAHSLRAVTATELAALVEGSGEPGAAVPLHVHVAEQTREVEECLAWCGARPVQWLLGEQPVDERWCLVHATHVDEGELAALAASGAVAGLCPSTEANLGDGLFPAARFAALGGRFGVGTDSHVGTSPVEELRWLEYGQRLVHRRRNVLAPGPGESTGSALYAGALAGGARALGRAGGALAPGRRADLVVLDHAHPALLGRAPERVLDAWLFAGNESPVSEVYVGGRRVIEDGAHPRSAVVKTRFERSLARLLGDA